MEYDKIKSDLLLQEVLEFFNKLPNTRISGIRSSYEIAKDIDKYFRIKKLDKEKYE